MRKTICILVGIMVSMAAMACYGQTTGKRFITPVEKSTNRTLLPRKGEKLEYVERDSLVLDSLRRDSIAKIYPRYPLITDVTVGVNFWDLVAKLFGQSYESYDVSLKVNMWNRLFPALELGVGRANSTPDGLNYTYKTPWSFYAKLGADYNFLFKSHPRYQFFVGVRGGYSAFKYSITGVTVDNGYWGESEKLEVPTMKSNALYGEVVAGLKVQLSGPISAGWTVKYHTVFKHKKNGEINPWYIPGFGSRESSLYVGMSVYYTFKTSKKKWPNIDDDGKLIDPGTAGHLPTDSISTDASNQNPGLNAPADGQEKSGEAVDNEELPLKRGQRLKVDQPKTGIKAARLVEEEDDKEK